MFDDPHAAPPQMMSRRPSTFVLVCAALIALALPGSAHADTGTPVGTVVQWGGTSVPAGWLRADGASVSRTAYPELFASIGTTYGAGDGSTTFELPDLRQRFVLGQAAAGTGSTIGATGGSIDHTHALASHAHSIASGGGHAHAFGSHTHSLPGHRHTNLFGISMTAGGEHNHGLDGDRRFLIVNGTNTLYNLAGGSTEIDQNQWTTTAGNHNHGYSGTVGNAGSGNNGNAAFSSTSATPATSATVGSHDHGAATTAASTTSSAANPAFLSVAYLIKASTSAGSPCGAIWWTARATPAPGALLANGAATSRTTQANLFSCLSTRFGSGDGSTTFNRPDQRGRFALGQATSGTGSVLGGSGGSLDHTHGIGHAHGVGTDGAHTVTMPSHTHNVPGHYHSASLSTSSDGAHAHRSNQGGAFVSERNNGNWRGSGGSRDYDTPTSTTYGGGHNHSVSGSVGNSSGPLGNSAFATTASAAVTSSTAGATNHGGATSGTTSATSGAANPPFRALNAEVYTSAAYAPATGTISAFAGTGTPPAGWHVADGAAVSRAEYSELFALIGTTYGAGDGSTTFNLPDLRGRMPLGVAAAGTGSTLGASGGALDHDHSATHAHALATTADHDHAGVGHAHTMPGHHHDFTRTFGGDGNHQHAFPGGNFWGTHISGGSMPVQDVAQGGSRNAAHVTNTDTRWGSHRHSSVSGTVGQSADPNGNYGQGSGTTDPDVVNSGGHTHAVGTTSPGVSNTNPPFIALRYMIRVTTASIDDNQSGDATWRRSNVASYDVDFHDPSGVARFETNVWSGTGQTGTQRQAWTQVAAPGVASYTTDWSLAASTWTALAQGVNHVSVRMWTTGDAQQATLVDAFYVRKDTLAAAPTGIADGSASDIDWSDSTSAIDASWTASVGEVGRSGVQRYEYCIASSAGCSGTIERTWTSVGTATSISATGLTLADGTTWRIAVRMVDNAGNVSAAATSDGFTVDTSAPLAPTLVSPPDGSAHPSWPALTATYRDPAPGSSGTLEFEVCSDSGCSNVVEGGASAGSIAPGANGSFTPTAPDDPYWWRARGTDAAGNVGPWSASRELQVGNSTVVLATEDTPLGLVTPGVPAVQATTIDVSSNAINGYQVQVADASSTIGLWGPANVADWTGSVASPTIWPSGTVGYVGMTVLDAPGGRMSKWGTSGGPYPKNDFSNNRFAGLGSTPQTIHQRSGFDPSSQQLSVAFRFSPSATVSAGTYTTSVTITVIANP